MGFYFEDSLAMENFAGSSMESVFNGIIDRYLAANPAQPLSYRAYCTRGIVRGEDFRYHADFNTMFPEAENETCIYAWSKYYSEQEGSLRMAINCAGPLVLYCNNEQVFRSTFIEERYSERRSLVDVPIKAGWNHFVIRFKKTAAGFGGSFGTWLGKHDYYFCMPSLEREGQEGWLFCEPRVSELPCEIREGLSEAESTVRWLPETEWAPEQLATGQLRRLFGLRPNMQALGWSLLDCRLPGLERYTLQGSSAGAVQIFIDHEQVFSSSGGAFSLELELSYGRHNCMVISSCGTDDWGFDLQSDTEKTAFISPCTVKGSPEVWIYCGPFAADAGPDLRALETLHALVRTADGNAYWLLDSPNTRLRPYNENRLYGNWNYPLGVTLYGLLHAARYTKHEYALEYIRKHVQLCCDTFDYALWDRQEYGGATTLHPLLTSIDSLDDCGSFGSLVLEAARLLPIHGYEHIAAYIADYISNKQVRLEDGTFFRKDLMHVFHDMTLWADDLYMSVPFLCRYYQLSGDRRYLDDAARQFIGFKKRLFMPEKGCMAHVYDFNKGMATGIPWGRGNGWTIFSLTELLEVLPADHELRPQLIDFLNELCNGYLALQGKDGMWHQVLNDHDSYPESSCTSMFIYAFCRAVRYGWLKDGSVKSGCIQAVHRAWASLMHTSIDRSGNIHGVCRGSEFSFTPDYYKHELLWTLNDTHGVGIVLLAGVELTRLQEYLQNIKH